MSLMKTLAASALALAALSALATPATAAPKATGARTKVLTALVVLMPGNRTAVVRKSTPRADRCSQAALATALGVASTDLTVEARLNDNPARCVVHLSKAVDISGAITLQNGQPAT